MNILFVCSANKKRSKTGEDFMPEFYPEHSFDSTGTNEKQCRKYHGTFLTEEMLSWANIVFAMEKKHFNLIKEHTGNKYIQKIHVLNIYDTYDYGQEELKEILVKKIKKFL